MNEDTVKLSWNKSQVWSVVQMYFSAGVKVFSDIFKEYFKFDGILFFIIIAYAFILLPNIFTQASSLTDLIWVSSLDEPAITKCLESMTVYPFGNPANYWTDLTKVPLYWQPINYSFWVYCGGLQETLAFPIFAPLKWLGFSTFPLGPILLRMVSFLSGLLCITLVYNFSNRYIGKIAAIFSVFFLIFQQYFILFSYGAHPDILMMLMCLCALVFASAHVTKRNLYSLVFVGVFIGLAQSAKFGGPFLIPMALLAVYWGLKPSSEVKVSKMFVRVGCRIVLLGFSAIVAFFIATPHALIWGDYWRSILDIVNLEHIYNVSFIDWAKAIWKDQWVIITGSLISIVYLIMQWRQGEPNKPLILASMLTICSFLWYMTLSRSVVTLYYLILPYTLCAILLGYLLQFVDNVVCARGIIGKRASRFFLLIIPLMLLIGNRWYLVADRLIERLNSHNPIHFNTQFALAHFKPTDVILSDISSVPLFDTNIFPNQITIGTLKYIDIWNINPNYFILSLGLANNPMYKKLRATQHLSITNSYPFSVRLYQDLLDKTKTPTTVGPTSVPWIKVVGMIRSGGSIVYQINSIGGPHGRPAPISGGDSGNKAAYVFADSTAIWDSKQTGKNVDGAAYVGFDFGGYVKVPIRIVQVTWPYISGIPKIINIQFRDGTDAWKNAGTFRPIIPMHALNKAWKESYHLSDVGAHREWRILAASPLAAGQPLSIQNVDFLNAKNLSVFALI